MKFGKVNTLDASDCILAHSLRVTDGRIRKGTAINALHIERLLSSGIEELTVAKLEDDDIHEDNAATLLATSLLGEGITLGRAATGRVNCYANTAGLLTIPRDRLLAINNISETITVSTLQENRWVEEGKMIATIKIIPYAVASGELNSAIEACSTPSPSLNQAHTQSNKLCVHAPKPRKAYLLQTTMPDMASAILDKTERVTNRRLTLRNAQLVNVHTCPHDVSSLTQLLITVADQNSIVTDKGAESEPLPNNWILISGASAISDRQDVIPQAVQEAGGTVTRFGIPVDPGNLLMLGHIKNSTVIGIPGCARSPKHNGLDLFMDRLACNLPITKEWINSLAIGGLMDEIISRPTPRSHAKDGDTSMEQSTDSTSCNVTAILLAGGSSKRFGADNKLLAQRNGKPLIAYALDTIIQSQIRHITIVVGCDATNIESYCKSYLESQTRGSPITVEFIVNADFESGMGSSLKAGVSAVLNRNIRHYPSIPHAALICLADMPSINPSTVNALINTMNEVTKDEMIHSTPEHAAAFVPSFNNSRGNPVLLMPELFDLLLDLSEDFGARHLLQANREAVREVPVNDAGIFLDLDTQEQLRNLENDSL